MEFRPRELVWTPVLIERFWTWLSSSEAQLDNYFSKRLGSHVIDFAARHGVLVEPVLDYGCGPGFLLELLLEKGLLTAALDNSQSSLDAVRSKFADHPRLERVILARGVPTDAPEGHYTTVFFIETIEHLLDDDLHSILGDLARVLKPGGHLILTTPNEENLDAAKVLCPDCGAIFHRVQHVRSFSGESVAGLLRQYGLEAKVIHRTNLLPATLINSARMFVRRRLERRKELFLFVIAERI